MHPRDAQGYGWSRKLVRSFAVVGGRRVAYVRLGEGSPRIVLLGGAGMDIDSWFKVLPEIVSPGTVIAVDRLGVGRSDRPTEPQTGEVVVLLVRSVLAQAGIEPPYVLVGHSLGGLFAQLYARHHPGEVSGVVLVEAASPDEAAAPPQPGRFARAANALATGLDRLRGRPRGLGEVDNVPGTVRQVRAAPPFPDVPLVVVTGGQRMRLVPEAAFAAHQEAQRALVGLSPRGRQVIASASGHFPQLQEPAVVVAAIRDTARAADPATVSRDRSP